MSAARGPDPTDDIPSLTCEHFERVLAQFMPPSRAAQRTMQAARQREQRQRRQSEGAGQGGGQEDADNWQRQLVAALHALLEQDHNGEVAG